MKNITVKLKTSTCGMTSKTEVPGLEGQMMELEKGGGPGREAVQNLLELEKHTGQAAGPLGKGPTRTSSTSTSNARRLTAHPDFVQEAGSKPRPVSVARHSQAPAALLPTHSPERQAGAESPKPVTPQRGRGAPGKPRHLRGEAQKAG